MRSTLQKKFCPKKVNFWILSLRYNHDTLYVTIHILFRYRRTQITKLSNQGLANLWQPSGRYTVRWKWIYLVGFIWEYVLLYWALTFITRWKFCQIRMRTDFFTETCVLPNSTFLTFICLPRPPWKKIGNLHTFMFVFFWKIQSIIWTCSMTLISFLDA